MNSTVNQTPETIRAKPLEWREPTDHPMDHDENSILVADGLGGKYHISDRQMIDMEGTIGNLLWWAHDEFIWEPCADIDDAKAKAEADWQSRFAAQVLS